jgi:hypothetical protein
VKKKARSMRRTEFPKHQSWLGQRDAQVRKVGGLRYSDGVMAAVNAQRANVRADAIERDDMRWGRSLINGRSS